MDVVSDWIEAHSSSPNTIELGLARVRAVKERLRLSFSAPVIIVGGTNGKGSVCALLQSVLAAAGFRVGCYLSPHLFNFCERVQVDGAPVDGAVLLDALKNTHTAAQQTRTKLTYFELATLAAAQVLQKSEVVILEVGLGGRLDAVNVFEPAVSVITNVALDHQEYLGNTRAAIAGEKAGIGRAGVATVVGCADSYALLKTPLEKCGARAVVAGRDFSYQAEGRQWHFGGRRRLRCLPLPALAGAHQVGNAATALAALEQLPAEFLPGFGAVREGMHSVRLAGRAQVLPPLADAPVMVADVAHNPAAAAVLERFLFAMGYYPQTHAVFGMLKRKDVAGVVRALKKRVDVWHIATPAGGDLPAAEMAAAMDSTGVAWEAHGSIADAGRAAMAAADKSDRIVITGSFLTVADFYSNCYKQDYGKKSGQSGHG